MTIPELQKNVITPLREKKESLDGQRIQLTYQDLVDMSGLAEALESVFGVSQRDSDNQAIVKRVQLTGILVVILKTLYVFADIYISTLLHELLDLPSGRISLVRFLQCKGSPFAPSLDSILRAYCLVVYRNKLIAHHDLRRTYAYALNQDGTYRLTPLPTQIQIAQGDVEELQRLRSIYQPVIPALLTEENYFNHLRLLFYGIPIGTMGEICQNRKSIDAIAERGGCPSMTRGEILDATDAFSLAMVKALNNAILP